MPPSSQTALDAIFNQVINLLGAINADTGYRTTVDTVEDFDLAALDDVSANIRLGVFVRGYSIGQDLTKISPAAERQKAAIIGIRAGIRSSVQKIDRTKKNLMCDVEQALLAPAGLGFLGTSQAIGALGTVRVAGLDFQDNGTQTDANAAYGAFLASLTVQWLGDPTVP